MIRLVLLLYKLVYKSIFDVLKLGFMNEDLGKFSTSVAAFNMLSEAHSGEACLSTSITGKGLVVVGNSGVAKLTLFRSSFSIS